MAVNAIKNGVSFGLLNLCLQEFLVDLKLNKMHLWNYVIEMTVDKGSYIKPDLVYNNSPFN